MDIIRGQRGLMAKVARELKISRGAVAMWHEIPPKHVPEVASITGIPRYELRPDLWEPPCQPPAEVEAA